MLNEECCKETKFSVFIESLEKNWSIEELSLILSSIKLLGYTTNQSNLVAEQIIKEQGSFRIFTGDKESAFKVIDKLVVHRIPTRIEKKINILK